MPGKFLPEFELYVLLAVAHLEDDAYGAAILREIEERTERPVSVGALYTTLGRLQEKGLIETQKGEPEEGQRGPARKYCSLTAAGEEALSHSAAMLLRMMDGLSIAHGTSREP